MLSLEYLFNVLSSGGWVMFPLIALALGLYIYGFQVLLFCKQEGPEMKNYSKWKSWVESPRDASGKVGEIIDYTQFNVQNGESISNRFDEIRTLLLGKVERRANVIKVFVSAAPLMGLLGTVIGMLRTFDGISRGGGSDTAARVADGISQALITTQCGLMIALPGVFMLMFIRVKIRKWNDSLEELESMTLTKYNFPN
jgi:biopolymer transport protein ExbB